MDIPRSFAEPMDFKSPATIRFGLDPAINLSESVEAMPVGPPAVLDSGGCRRLLLRGGMLAVWSSVSAISGPDNNGRSLEDTF